MSYILAQSVRNIIELSVEKESKTYLKRVVYYEPWTSVLT